MDDIITNVDVDPSTAYTQSMGELRVDVDLRAEDVSAAVDLMLRSTPTFIRIRRLLTLGGMAALILAGVGVIAAEGWLFHGLQAGNFRFRELTTWHQTLFLIMPFLWGLDSVLLYSVHRDPTRLLRWWGERVKANMLKRGRLGPRKLILGDKGLVSDAEGAIVSRAWTQIQRARADEKILVVAARGLWFIVPLTGRLAEERSLIAEQIRSRVALTIFPNP